MKIYKVIYDGKVTVVIAGDFSMVPSGLQASDFDMGNSAGKNEVAAAILLDHTSDPNLAKQGAAMFAAIYLRGPDRPMAAPNQIVEVKEQWPYVTSITSVDIDRWLKSDTN